MPIKDTGFEHEAFFQDLNQLLKKHAGHLDAVEMLAIASNVVGKLTAMQDHRTMTSQKVMKIVSENIELGNRQMVEEAARGILGTPP